MTNNFPNETEITPTTPLRLAIAARLAFPDGTVTERGLRAEYHRGRLTIERIAGKDYTTLAAIEEMRQLCQLRRPLPVEIDIRENNEGAIALMAARATLRERMRSHDEDRHLQKWRRERDARRQREN